MQALDDLLPHMRHVLAAERELQEQKLMWSMIEASSAIGCPEQAESLLPTLSLTREQFAGLQQRLVGALARENLESLGDELAARAQGSIDILVRNLYERTADVGFLATDEPLRSFCQLDEAARAEAVPALRQRLDAYRATYSVYDDIVVLAPDGSVLLRLDEAGAAEHCSEPWLAAAAAREGFVEHSGPSVLAPPGEAGLFYAHRIASDQGAPCGVLVLRFRIADETALLFAATSAGREDIAVMLVDAQGLVLHSNDPSHVPPGTTLRPVAPGGVQLTTFAGREYLAVNCPARPYQGYPGPGWRAQAMVSLLTAFRAVAREAASEGHPVSLDDDALRAIRSEVDAINRNLRRVVWNGRLMAGGTGGDGRASLKAVLHQVTLAGARMRLRVGDAIGDLHQTSLVRTQRRAAETARLAADIMDRNLYERANDARWWALSPVLREGLAAPAGGEGDARMAATLAGIHALYTVYTRLVVFDADGVVRASSRPGDEGPIVGQPVDPRWRATVLGLRDPRRYAVSEFEACALSDGKPAYVYLAAVRAPGDAAGSATPVGGVAIAFNAERELAAMLADVLGGRPGFAAFIDARQRVVACTDPAFAPGSAWTLPTKDGVFERDGAHHALAGSPTPGYREFKRSDGYDNGVRVLVSLRLGNVERRRHALFDEVLRSHATAQGARRREIAVFQVGPARYALPVDAVREACAAAGIVRTPGADARVIGLIAEGEGKAGMRPVWCARRLFGVNSPARDDDGVVLMLNDPQRPGAVLGGLRVDDVHSVLEVDEQQLQVLPEAMRQGARWLHAVVRVASGADSAGRAMLQMLDLAEMAEALQPGSGARRLERVAA